MVEDFQKKEKQLDMYGIQYWPRQNSVIAATRFKGKSIFGVSSDDAPEPVYTAEDWDRAIKMRANLIRKYPATMAVDNIGEMPNDSVFHSESTLLMRAADKNGGNLQGETLEVYVNERLCPSCKIVLPLLGKELGNPTVIFFDKFGGTYTMRNGQLE